MDVNGTRFHLLFGETDWRSLQGLTAPFESHWARSSFGLESVLFQFPASAGDREVTMGHRRGAARDRFGNVYWIAESRDEIRVIDADGRAARHFWGAGDTLPPQSSKSALGDFTPCVTPAPPRNLKLSGLAVTADHYLVVGNLQPAGLLVFDLHSGGEPTELLWPVAVDFRPLDFSARKGGGLWILDWHGAVGVAPAPRLWQLDPAFRVVAEHASTSCTVGTAGAGDFAPAFEFSPPEPRCEAPAILSADLAREISALCPVGIEALPDDSVLILDRGHDEALLHRYVPKGAGERQTISGLDSLIATRIVSGTGAPFRLRAHDLALIPQPNSSPAETAATLYLVGAGGNQAFAFNLEASSRGIKLQLLEKYLPMRLFGGKSLVSGPDTILYDRGDAWPVLQAHPRPMYREMPPAVTGLFDGRDPGCVWHRLLMDACLPNGTKVTIESRASDDKDTLAHSEWDLEPAPYCRIAGSEQPWDRPLPNSESDGEGLRTWELLFQNARGRYLQLRLTLHGNGRASPRLRALRIYYPRFSYLKEYLPACYRDDTTSASFLERFLANVEGLYTSWEGRIENAQALFDARTVPREYLDWLARWIGLAFDTSWDERRRRLFLAHALSLFHERGTPRGLVRALRLATEPCAPESLFITDSCACGGGCSDCRPAQRGGIRLVEQFLQRTAPGVVLGDPTDTIGPVRLEAAGSWTPRLGAESLHQRFRDYLAGRYPDPTSKEPAPSLAAIQDAWEIEITEVNQLQFSPLVPDHPRAAIDWKRFVREGLGFTYADITADDVSLFQQFLSRRYTQVPRLNAAYQLGTSQALSAFAQIELPTELPSTGARLSDWIEFASVVVPLRRHAHRFTVLIPVSPEESQEAATQKANLVRRVIEIEKPAHTAFEVKLFWALLRLGEARLGLDTQVGHGARFEGIVLGRTSLADGYLAPTYPGDVSDRQVLGRDPVRPGRAGDSSPKDRCRKRSDYD